MLPFICEQGKGLQELNCLLHSPTNICIGKAACKNFLDSMITNRIARRMIVHQHLAVRSPDSVRPLGTVHSNCNPVHLVVAAYANVRDKFPDAVVPELVMVFSRGFFFFLA